MSLPVILRLPRMPRRNSRDEVGIHNTALHQIDRMMVSRVAQAVVVEEIIRPVQARRAQNMFPRHSLMPEIMHGEAHPRMPHAKVLIHLVKQHRHQPRLPVVAMDDIGMLVRLEHELHGRPAEECEAQEAAVLPVVRTAVEKVVPGMRVDEITLPPVYEAKPYGGGNSAAIPWDHQVFVRFR